MTRIGIRELKTRASEIVREVREQHASYVVTHRGKPVGLLTPYQEGSEITTPTTEYGSDPWRELERMGTEISSRWKSENSSSELVSEMRR
ncbi:MAG: type II toxin-antitoxin system Phd/YefM family antitoxin [bacterium]|nr:type II toxin-antitoxin system Phd/YefM family antitoxin [bacterium]